MRSLTLILAVGCVASLGSPAHAYHGRGGCGGYYGGYGGYYGGYGAPYAARSTGYYSYGSYYYGPMYGSAYRSAPMYGGAYRSAPTYAQSPSDMSGYGAYSSSPTHREAYRPAPAYGQAYSNGSSRLPARLLSQPTTLVSIGIQDNSFQPATITVQPGSTVRWTNQGSHNHTVTAQDGRWDSGDIAPGATYSATFQHAGTYTYYCRHHAGMQGSIVVGSGGSAPSTARPGNSPFEARTRSAAPPARNY